MQRSKSCQIEDRNSKENVHYTTEIQGNHCFCRILFRGDHYYTSHPCKDVTRGQEGGRKLLAAVVLSGREEGGRSFMFHVFP